MPQKKTKTSFKKGNTKSVGAPGNTKAKPDREERVLKKVDAGIVQRYISLNSHYTLGELQNRLKDKNRKNMTMLEYMILRCMIVCAQTGDTNRLDTILDRIVGKVSQKIEHGVIDPYESMPTDDLIKLKKKLEGSCRQTMNHLEQLPDTQRQNAEVEAEYRDIEASGELQPTDLDTTNSD
jgi:hypothetical protein